jgi:hypothetical protein
LNDRLDPVILNHLPVSCMRSRTVAVMFGAYEQDGAHALFALPEAAFELSFAIYLIVKGFRPSSVLSGG